MPRNKLQAALKNNGGAIANVTPRYEKLTDEQMRLAAFEARDNQEGAITDKMANSNRRNTLLAEMGLTGSTSITLSRTPTTATPSRTRM